MKVKRDNLNDTLTEDRPGTDYVTWTENTFFPFIINFYTILVSELKNFKIL